MVRTTASDPYGRPLAPELYRMAEQLTAFEALRKLLDGGPLPITLPPIPKPKKGAGLTKPRIESLRKRLTTKKTTLKKAAKEFGVPYILLTDALRYNYGVDWWEVCSLAESSVSERQCAGCGRTFCPPTKNSAVCSAKCGSRKKRDDEYFGGKRMTAVGLREGICQICWEPKKRLAAHHVLGKENDPENKYLMAVCNGCHSLITDLSIRKFLDNPGQVEFFLTWCLIRRGRKDAKAEVTYSGHTD